jgi:hypothetical protein
MTVVLPASIPKPIIGGRWVDSSSTGQSLIVLSPAVTLVDGAEWYLQGGTAPGSLVDMVSSDFTGPASSTDGSGNPVQVFTATKINGVVINRYTQYYFAVGQRDPANRVGSFVHSIASSGAYPTNGWNSGTTIIPKIQIVTSATASASVTLTWNAVSGVDFSKTYVVQRAIGTTPPAEYTSNPGAAPDFYVATGTSEQNAISTYGITGFYSYQETTGTSIPVTIADDNGAHWTWYRVMARSDLWGYTGVFQAGATGTQWVGVRNDTQKYSVTSTSGNVVVGEPTSTSSSDTTSSSTSDPVLASSLQMETNLPMLANGIGGINHMRLNSRVRWRDGIMVLNGDQTVSKSHTTRRWGFRFHYNPSTWSQSSAIAQDIDLTTYSQTGGNLLLPTAFSTVDLTIYLNRIVELSTDVDPADPEGVANRAHALAGGDFNLGSGDGVPLASINPVGLDGSYFDWNGSTQLPLTSGGYSTVEDKITEVLKKGTLADLEYLYRAVNGDPVDVTHTTGKTADIGMLAMTILDLYLGPNIRYTVRISSASIQHMMFSNRMIPTFTQVQLSMIRGITMASTSDYSPTAYSTAQTKADSSTTTGSTSS